jgi:hypothetical protein
MIGKLNHVGVATPSIDESAAVVELGLNVTYADPVVRGTRSGSLLVRLRLTRRGTEWTPTSLVLLKDIPQ